LFEEITKTLFCGDLFTHFGKGPAVTRESIVDAAVVAQEAFHPTSIGLATVPTIRPNCAPTGLH
jgi:hypothetical protein